MGDYIRIQKIGSGGFGEVWLARHVGLNVLHAVKFVSSSAVSCPTEFYKEPRLLKTLEHSSIVKVYDAGFSGTDLFIAMEYHSEGSLEKWCSKGPIKLRRIKAIFCEALRGLQFVHDRGYLHRDIKPANILLTGSLQGRLADFGLALPRKDALIALAAGTVNYLAPEVFVTGEMSVQSDIYAMGVSLYEAVNGSAYLPAITRTSSLADAAVAGTYPDRSYYRIYTPRSLKVIINKAMHRDSTRRYQSADQFREALEQTHIRCSWVERHSPGLLQWITSSSDERVSVELTPATVGYDLSVTVKKNPSSGVRRVRKLCRRFTARAEAMAEVARITTGMVSGLDLKQL